LCAVEECGRGGTCTQGEPAVLAVVEGEDTAAFQTLLKDAFQVQDRH